MELEFSGRVVKVAKVPKLYDPECIRARDTLILKMTRQGQPSRVIGRILNINPVSVRRIRARLAKRLEGARHAEEARVG